jgi:hypothetical protein
MILFQNKVEENGEYKKQQIKNFMKLTVQVQRGGKVSKQFFIYTIMAAEYFRHSKRPKFCPLCEELDGGNLSLELLQHKQLIPVQRGEYTKEKLEIGTEKLKQQPW